MLPVDVDAILRAQATLPLALSYQKDCYALSLLCHVIGGGRSLATLRRGPFARLLDKAIVKRALAHATHGMLTPKCLRRAMPSKREDYPVTLGRWGGKAPPSWRASYYQTSRPGENVVLQLNFPAAHDRAYLGLVRPEGEHPFLSRYHPTRAEAPFTLAWARLDFDTVTGEVLIEEVQSDWVKGARFYREEAEEWLADGEPGHHRFTSAFAGTAPEALAYFERVLAPHARVWEECVLSAALEFAYSRLSARRVFFHTHEGGRIMKRLYFRSLPPRSLYTDLPERFCFTRTTTPPRMFRRDNRVRRGGVEWFVLELV